jgi:hypothetical protein
MSYDMSYALKSAQIYTYICNYMHLFLFNFHTFNDIKSEEHNNFWLWGGLGYEIRSFTIISLLWGKFLRFLWWGCAPSAQGLVSLMLGVKDDYNLTIKSITITHCFHSFRSHCLVLLLGRQHFVISLSRLQQIIKHWELLFLKFVYLLVSLNKWRHVLWKQQQKSNLK